MKTKLEIGKEYWLGEAKKYKGIYKGNFGDAHYFEATTWIPTYRDEQAHVPFIKDANGFVEFPLRGVFEVESWQFTTPIAMKCTEEQFNGIKDKLVEMGYSGCQKTISFDKYGYLTNRYGTIGNVNCTDKYISKSKVSNWFESFNPDMFIALAAMTDKEDGIKGEWWMNTATGKIQKQVIDSVCNFNIRKATAQEIIEHFEKKEFVLSYAYMVCVSSKEEYLSVLEYARTKGEFKEDFNDLTPNAFPYYIGMEKNGSWSYNNRYISACDGVKITFDQFKKYVLKETEQSCQIIYIPPTKQATLFDDRVEITDWNPKEGDFVFYIAYWNDEFRYTNTFYNDNFKKEFNNGFIKRTESEAKQLVEKLKQAML